MHHNHQDTFNHAARIATGPSVAALVISVQAPGQPRYNHAESELLRLGLGGRIVSGVKCDDPSNSQLNSKWKNLLFAKRSLTAGEIACYASHRKAWREFLEGEAQFALILEDDFFMPEPDTLRATIADCVTNSSQWDIVKFFEFSRKRIWRTQFLNSTKLVAFKYQSAGAVGYLVNRRAAARLLSRQVIFRPVDEDLSCNWEFGLRVWTTPTDLVRDVSNTLGGSHLENQRKSIKKNDRNTLRSLWGNVIAAWKLTRATFQHFQQSRLRERQPFEEQSK